MVFQECPSCGITKTAEEYNKGSRPNGLSSYCKSCCYVKHVCKTYKISQEVYFTMVKEADGLCQCCGKEPKRLVVDHDHTTHKVRGLICDVCNHFIGMLETIPNITSQAESYLANTKE